MRQKVRQEFRKNKEIPRMKMNRIEYLLRVGKNKFEMVKSSNVTWIN